MRRRVAASFLLGLRAPLRSRLVAALLLLVAAAVVVLPAQLRTDGTDAGTLRMLLTWTLGPVVALLGAASLWAGCAAVSTEIEDKRFVGAATTPARPFEIWLGRWLGLVALDALLLAAALGGAYLQARARVPAPARAVRALLPLDPAGVEEQVRRIYRDAMPEGAPDGREEDVLEAIRRDLAGEAYLPVGPGQGRDWRVRLPRRGGADGLRIDFSFLSAYGAAEGAKGSLRALRDDGREIAALRLTGDEAGAVSIAVPDGALDGARTLTVAFRNEEDPESGAAVLVRHFGSMRATVPHGGLAANLARAGVALLAALSLLAALGTACGCCFSFPVAAFVATAVCAMVLVSGGADYGEEAHSHAAAPGAVERAAGRFSERASRALRAATGAIDRAEALDRLGDGISVDAASAWAALLADGVALPLLLGALGAIALRRRELP